MHDGNLCGYTATRDNYLTMNFSYFVDNGLSANKPYSRWLLCGYPRPVLDTNILSILSSITTFQRGGGTIGPSSRHGMPSRSVLNSFRFGKISEHFHFISGCHPSVIFMDLHKSSASSTFLVGETFLCFE